MMHMQSRKNEHSRMGSIVLELALAMPVFLLIGAFLLTAISCCQADILFSQATDQVTQEVSLLVPVIGAGIDVAETAAGVINHVTVKNGAQDQSESTKETATGVLAGIAVIMETLGIDPQDQITTVLLGKAIHDRIISVYQSYCKDEVLSARIDEVGVYIDIDNDTKVIWLRVYYRWQTLFGPCDRMITSAVPIYGDLTFVLPETETEENKKDEVWLLGNFERGQILRSEFGANLPFSYPVIAKWSGNTATSIKSIDLTAPEYQSGNALFYKVKQDIQALQSFSGTPNGFGKSEVVINEENIANRVLLIIIPENSPENVYNTLESSIDYAAERNIQIVIQKYGKSYRFLPKNETVTDG